MQSTFRRITAAIFLLAAIAFSLSWQSCGALASATATMFSATYSGYAKVTADDGESDDRFGSAVAVSEDGSTIVVGAATDDLGVTQDHGSVYVYTRQAGNAVFQQQLLANGASVQGFGSSVAISGDTIAVGSPGDDNNTGAIYIFVKTGGVWTQTQRLTPNDVATDDYFGQSISFSGNIIVGGSAGDANARGSAYVFVRNGGTWSQQWKLIANDGAANDLFGGSVAVNGETVVVGAQADAIDANSGQGSAYVFVRLGNLWQQQQKLLATDGAAGDGFGRAVALDGETAVIGSWLDGSLLFTQRGSAYVFVRSGTNWSQQAKLAGSDASSNDLFGNAVALSGDSAVIGAFGKNVGGIDLKGKIYVFTRTGTAWSEQQDFTTSNNSGSLFGNAVAFANDTIAVGAPRETSHKGAAYIYRPVNHAPTINPVATLNLSAGSSNAGVTVATAGEQDQPVGSLQITVNGAMSATSNGITVSDLDVVGLLGVVRATVNVGCGASDASFTLRVTDSEGEFAQALLVVNVTPNITPVLSYGSPQTVNIGGSLTVSPASGPSDNGTITSLQALSITPSFNGGFSVTPAGVVTIGAAGPAGTYTATVRATDNCGLIRNATFTLIVTGNCQTISVNPATLSDGVAGANYNRQLTASGGSGPYTYAISNGALPNGMTLSTSGLLAGAPTVFGTFNFTVRATDLNGCQSTRAYTLTINAPCASITVNPTTLANGITGAAYNQTIMATGGAAPYGFTLSSGTLPTGLSLAANGVLSGTPTVANTFNFTVRATDANGCLGTHAYTVAITSGVVNNGLQFYPLAHPVRLLDTRPGQTGCDAPAAPIAGISSRTQMAAGRTCDGLLIPATARALTGNITTVQSGGGYLTLYPSDAQQPLVANSNYSPNEIVNNVFTVGLGANDGAFNIFVTTNTDIVVDVTGYYAPPAAANSGGLYFHPLPHPIRLLETRSGFNGAFTPGLKLQANTDTLQPAQISYDGVTIPATALAIVGNATSLNSGVGYLTLYPADAQRPLAASSNFTAGQVMNAPFTVGLSAAGGFNIFSTTNTDLVIDVLGYYSTEASDANGVGLLFNSLTSPVRLLETRAGFTGCYTPNAPLLTGSTRQQQARGACGGQTIAANALAIVGNATVINDQAGYLTFWPNGAAQPLVASSNFAAGQILNRHFTVGLGATGVFNIFASSQTDLIVDVSGFFAP